MIPKGLHLLLAPKERFEPEGAGAFALNVLETSRVSRFRSNITVFGSAVANPFAGIRFVPLGKARWWEGDRNRAMARRYRQLMCTNMPALIEVYNRPVIVDVLRAAFHEAPIVLHLGNDPRVMRGSRSAADRRKLLKECTVVVCVSDYIRRCFLHDMGDTSARVQVIHTGVPRAPSFPSKEKEIVYVGRVVPEKGVLELVEALAHVLPRHPDWRAEIIGSRWFGGGEKPSEYETRVATSAAQCRQIVLGGFKSHEDVLGSLRRASVAVVPSIWDDPFPRTALEALAQGCALVCSTRGGLPELPRDSVTYLEHISTESLCDALDDLIANDQKREFLQRRSWNEFPFDIHTTTSTLDDLRETLMSSP